MVHAHSPHGVVSQMGSTPPQRSGRKTNEAPSTSSGTLVGEQPAVRTHYEQLKAELGNDEAMEQMEDYLRRCTSLHVVQAKRLYLINNSFSLDHLRRHELLLKMDTPKAKEIYDTFEDDTLNLFKP